MRVHKEHRIECTPQRFFDLLDPEVERRTSIDGMALSGSWPGPPSRWRRSGPTSGARTGRRTR